MPSSLPNKEDYKHLDPKLLEKLAERVENTGVPLVGDEELVRHWPDIPPASEALCLAYLDAFVDTKNTKAQGFVVDPMAGKVKYPGVYRLVSNRMSTQASGLKGIIQTLRKGFADSPKWDEARIAEGDSALTNGESAGISNTTSDSPAQTLLVKFPNFNPAKLYEAVASLNSGTYTTVSVGGVPYAGTWYNHFASFDRQEDGSGTVYIKLGRNKLTLSGFQDKGGVREQTFYRIHNVALPLAQPIINSWGTSHPLGSSATFDVNEAKQTANITLSTTANVEQNLSITGVNLQCDTVAAYHYACGYAESSIAGFISAHNSAANMAGVSRRVTTQNRGDGFFDIIIEEITVTYAASKHLFTITPFSGDSTGSTIQYQYGWNIPKDKLEALRTPYQTPVQNRRSDFKVTRNDNCTFDYVAFIEIVLPTTATVTVNQSAADNGIGLTVEVKENQTAAPAASTATRRQRKRAEIEKTKLSGFNTRIVTETVAARAGDTSAIGSHRIIFFGSNMDDLPSVGDNSIVIGGTVSPGDDGAINYNLIVKDLSNPVTGLAVYGNGGKLVTESIVEDGDPENIPASGPTGVIGETLIVTADLKEEGAANWRERYEQTFPLPATSTEKTFKQTSSIVRTRNAIAPAAVSATLAAGTREVARNEANDDLSFETELTTITGLAAESEVIEYFNDGIVSKSLQFYWNQETTSPEGVTIGPGTELISPTHNDFGLYDFAIKRVTIISGAGTLVIQRQNGNRLYIDTVKSMVTNTKFENGLVTFTGTPGLFVMQTQRYETQSMSVTRTFSLGPESVDELTPATPPTAPTTPRTEYEGVAGYDNERELYFIDTITNDFSGLKAMTPEFAGKIIALSGVT